MRKRTHVREYYRSKHGLSEHGGEVSEHNRGYEAASGIKEASIVAKTSEPKEIERVEYPVIRKFDLGDGTFFELISDESPESPREWDNMGKLVMFHHDYDFPNEADVSKDDFSNWDELRDFLVKEKGAAVVVPVYMLEHSGVWLRTSDFNDPWDSGQVGFAYVTNEDIQREFGKINSETTAKARANLEGEVETYGQYLGGDVFGFRHYKVNYCPSCAKPEEEEIDSVWGFYGTVKESGMPDHLDDATKKKLLKLL